MSWQRLPRTRQTPVSGACLPLLSRGRREPFAFAAGPSSADKLPIDRCRRGSFPRLSMERSRRVAAACWRRTISTLR